MTYSTAWTNSTPADPLTITISPTANQFLIAHAITDTANVNDLNTTPSGWTQIFRSQVTTDNQTHQVLYKVATGAETSVVFDSTSGNTAIGAVLAFDSIDTTTPLDVTPLTGSSSTSNANHDLGTLTPVTDGCDIVMMHGRDNGNSDYTFTFSTTVGTTGAWTTRADQRSGFMNCAGGTAVQTTAGGITVRCASTSGGRSSVLFALRPSSGGTTNAALSVSASATATFSGAASASAALAVASTSLVTFNGSSSNQSSASFAATSAVTFNGTANVSSDFSVVATAINEWVGESAAAGAISVPAVSLIEWIGESASQSEGVFSVSATSSVEWSGEATATAEFFVTAQSVATFSGSSSESDTENTDSLEAWKYIQKTWPQEQIAKRKKIAKQNDEFFKLVEMAFPMMLQEQMNQTKH